MSNLDALKNKPLHIFGLRRGLGCGKHSNVSNTTDRKWHCLAEPFAQWIEGKFVIKKWLYLELHFFIDAFRMGTSIDLHERHLLLYSIVLGVTYPSLYYKFFNYRLYRSMDFFLFCRQSWQLIRYSILFVAKICDAKTLASTFDCFSNSSTSFVTFSRFVQHSVYEDWWFLLWHRIGGYKVKDIFVYYIWAQTFRAVIIMLGIKRRR